MWDKKPPTLWKKKPNQNQIKKATTKQNSSQTLFLNISFNWKGMI